MGDRRDRHQEGSSSRSPSDGDRQAVAGGDLEERLMKALGEEEGEDLLLDRCDMEGMLLPWLRALDAQVIGACRADERLKPLVSVNAADGVVGDRLAIQLVQHFEASEVGMLARCLCLPLVSIRVGKVSKQGKFLCPTYVRPPPPVPELRISEEAMNEAAAMAGAFVNGALSILRDAALGKDTALFYRVAACLWIVSLVAGFTDLLTLCYSSLLVVLAVPAIYGKFEEQIDGCLEMAELEVRQGYDCYTKCFNKPVRAPSQKSRTGDLTQPRPRTGGRGQEHESHERRERGRRAHRGYVVRQNAYSTGSLGLALPYLFIALKRG